MIRSLKALAIAAAVAGGALAATAAQANANLNVSFAVQNNDASDSMGLANISSTITGLSAGPISPGASDPASGHATWSDTLPTGSSSRSATFQAEQYSPVNFVCTFTLKMTKDSNPQPYLLQISVDNSSLCTVPTISNPRTSDGQYTSSTLVFGWQS